MWPCDNLKGQFDTVTINTGNNQFWGFSSRQVENHTIEVRTRRNDSGEWTNPHAYLDTDCNYDGGDVKVANNVSPTAQINRLLIIPETENDREDYINGVSTLDIWVIQRYIDALSSLDNWQLTAANVNVNNVIDSNDINLIRDLVLAIRDDFGSGNRVSWGWVPHADVLTFLSESDPWVYALGYPGYWDVVFNNLSKNDITSSSANYFKFFAIKIGDVYATSTSGGNDWVCGTGGYGSYFRNDKNIQTRSLTNS
ncbi:MAG TPA: hypothetical protein PKC30_16750, partial [Saprospiraceae bacterium]|nr:hypothetical protein [Saprospiraceae bacterium]